jgi:hypothetical protein
MLVQQGEVASAIACGILYLSADIARGFSFPCHFNRSQAPARVTGNALVTRFTRRQRKVVVGVARCAMLTGNPNIAFATKCSGSMDVPVVTLVGLVTRRVAVHAAWAGDNFCRFPE